MVENLKAVLRPQTGPEVEIVVGWQERILGTYRFSSGRTITIGSLKTADVYLPVFEDSAFLHKLIDFQDKATIHLSPALKVAEVTKSGQATAVRENSIELNQGEMLRIDVAGGNVSIFVRYAPKAQKPVAGPWFGFTMGEGLAVCSSLLSAFVLSVFVSYQVAQVETEDLVKDPEAKRVAKFMYAPPAAGSAARMRKGDAKKIAEEAGASATTVKPDVSKMGVLGVLGTQGLRKKLDQAASGDGALQGLGEKATGGVGENQNLTGDHVGRAFENASGGGDSTIGIGGVGTKGKGIAGGKVGGLAGKASSQVRVGDESADYKGNIDREAIRRVIAENIGQIRACYENALNREPDLTGKLILEWQIDQDGKPSNAKVKKTSLNSQVVTNCVIHRLYTWRFPKPPPGVIGMVEYPFSFESSSQLRGG
jgi:hypothetical protein